MARTREHLGVYTSQGFRSGMTADEVKAEAKRNKLPTPAIFGSAPMFRVWQARAANMRDSLVKSGSIIVG